MASIIPYDALADYTEAVNENRISWHNRNNDPVPLTDDEKGNLVMLLLQHMESPNAWVDTEDAADPGWACVIADDPNRLFAEAILHSDGIYIYWHRNAQAE